MIDEKKIEEAAEKYTTETCTEDMSPVVKVTAEMSFHKGIDWFLSNLWHPMSDKPEMGAEILILRDMKVYNKNHLSISTNESFVHEFNFHDNWNSYANDNELKCWLYIEDLMKGGE